MKKYRAFISYSRKDTKVATWLHKNLEGYHIPEALRAINPHLPKTLGMFFKDTEDLSAHSSLNDALKETLRESEFLIVICSPASSHSHWVNEEIKYFKSIGGEDNVIPIIVDGEPNATTNPTFDSFYESFPEALRFKVDKDGNISRNIKNPIGGDIRKGKDSKSKALTRTISRMLNVDFDDIWKREKRRQRKTQIMQAVSIFIILGILLFGVQKWMKESQLRAVNSELSKLVKDRNGTKVNIKELQKKTADLIIKDNAKKELEETLISNTMAIELSIKSMKESFEMMRKLSSSAVPAYDLYDKRMLDNCKMMTNLSFPQIKEMERMQYCKCIYTNIVTNDEKKPKIDCAEPIRVLLDLPKTSEYRKKKTKEIEQQFNSINNAREEQQNKSFKTMEDAIKKSKEDTQTAMQKIPGWNSTTQTVNARSAYISICAMTNHSQLPNIDEILIKNYCQCLYDNTHKVIGDPNTTIKNPADITKDSVKFIEQQISQHKRAEEHGKLFQTESIKHKDKCIEPLKHLGVQ